MITAATFAALLFAQSASASLLTEGTSVEAEDAGYVELVSGEATAAVQQLEKLHAQNPDDPAIMINLAAAYIEIGRLDDANRAYRLAIASRERLQLETAEGDWEDSRQIARSGLSRLENSQAWAMK